MNKYIITYDLKKPGKNYDNLYNSIKSLGAWWHYLESTWIIKTDLTSTQIWNNLKSSIDNNDYLLIIKAESVDKEGWLPKSAWDWLNS